jgi:ABC-type uncharacterized transport system substrate-binding protein
MYIIGVISFFEDTIDEIRGIEDGLNQLGYATHLEQMGLKILSKKIGDYYYEEDAIILWLCRCFGDMDRCNIAIDAFIENRVDAIITMSYTALDLTLSKLEDIPIPILFLNVTCNVKIEERLTIEHKRGKLSGVWDIWSEIVAERLSLLTEVVPPPTTIHVFFNPELPEVADEVNELRRATHQLNIKLNLHQGHDTEEIKRLLTKLHSHQDHAIFRLADPTTSNLSSLMGTIAHEQNIPYIGLTIDELERCGALFAFEPQGAGTIVANMIDQIFKGENLASIEIEKPTKKPWR